MLDELTNRVALVTGAGRGIGKAIATALARAGVDVAVNYRSRADEAHDTCRAIEQLGRRSIAVKADVSDSAEVSRLVARVESELGPVAILVNNAGITRPQPVSEISEQDWDTIIAVNLKSVFLVTQAVLPNLRAARWGRIINLSSVAAQTGGVVGPHYAASKAGLIGFTESLRMEFRKRGVSASAVCPGLVSEAGMYVQMQQDAGVSIDVVRIIQALVLLFVAAPAIVRWLYRVRQQPQTVIEEGRPEPAAST